MTKEEKLLKKANKRYKKRATRPWKGLSILTGIISVIMVLAVVVVSMFDNTFAIMLNGKFWEIENYDENAVIYKSAFANEDERLAYGEEICEQVEEEGAALLKNDGCLPLQKGNTVSCFSNSSVNLIYGGTGSGNVDSSTAVNLKDALTSAGFNVNTTLWDFYTQGAGSAYQRSAGGMVSLEGASVVEVPWSVYDENTLSSATGTDAIVVFSRVGGEGSDLTYDHTLGDGDNYLALNKDEQDLLKGVTELKRSGKINSITVLINSANALQVDFLANSNYEVDACMWIGDVGQRGIAAVANIIAGDVVPSGSLADIYCYDNYSSAAMKNSVAQQYANAQALGVKNGNAQWYMVYQEGIYVGYKYYETRYEDYVLGTANVGNFNYGEEVAFPFGYGLSYTNFEYSDFSVAYSEETDKFTVSVTVTNNGPYEVAAKETVQIYAQSPYYYGAEKAVEKSAVSLVGFGKTQKLAVGESQTLNIEIERRDLASYDYQTAGTYILDEGKYYLTAATSSHEATNNILAAKGYTPANTENKMDAEGNASLVYGWEEEYDAQTYSVSASGYEIVNQLSQADINLYSGRGENSVEYIKRSNWAALDNIVPATVTLTEEMVADLQDVQYNKDEHKGVEMPELEQDHGLTLYEVMQNEEAKDDVDHQLWKDLVSQMSFEEMRKLIGDSFHWTHPVESVQAPGTRDENGPQGLTTTLFGAGSGAKATAFTSEDVMAATFNTDLIKEVGRCIGEDCLATGVSFLYGFGSNIHRTPYGGRNFEYYSEDGFLSGAMGAAEAAGLKEKGVGVLIKHFALNDSEQQRMGLGVWINEQAAREIYLKAYQMPIEKSGANGVMTAYTRWGTTWSGGNANLMTNILRGEWDCDGMQITDNCLVQNVNVLDGVVAGVTTFDNMLSYIYEDLGPAKTDAYIVTRMMDACRYNLYAIGHSNAMNGIGPNTTVKAVSLPIINTLYMYIGISVALFALCLTICIVKSVKFKKRIKAEQSAK